MNFNQAANIGSKSSLIVILIVLLVSILNVFNIFTFLGGLLIPLIMFLPGILSYFLTVKSSEEVTRKTIIFNGASSGLFTALLNLLLMLLIAFICSVLELKGSSEGFMVAMLTAILTAVFLTCFIMLTNSLAAVSLYHIKFKVDLIKKDVHQ